MGCSWPHKATGHDGSARGQRFEVLEVRHVVPVNSTSSLQELLRPWQRPERSEQGIAKSNAASWTLVEGEADTTVTEGRTSISV